MLDDGTTAVGVYALYSSSTSGPARILIYNSAYFTGGTRPTSSVTLSGIQATTGSSLGVKTFSASSATAHTDNPNGGGITIGTDGTFTSACLPTGNQGLESVKVNSGSVSFNVGASQAVMVFL